MPYFQVKVREKKRNRSKKGGEAGGREIGVGGEIQFTEIS